MYIKLKSYGGINVKNSIWKYLQYIVFDFSFTFKLWKIGTIWEKLEQQSCSARWNFLIAYHIRGGQEMSFFSAIQLKVVPKHWLRIYTQGPRLYPRQRS